MREPRFDVESSMKKEQKHSPVVIDRRLLIPQHRPNPVSCHTSLLENFYEYMPDDDILNEQKREGKRER